MIVTKLTGQQAKMHALSIALAKKHIRAITHTKGTPEWWAWHGWRKRNGLSNTFMDSRPTFGFPQDMPPEGSLDTALDEANAGTSSKRFET